MEVPKKYAKGFKIGRGLIAKAFDLPDRNDIDVNAFLILIVENLNRQAYEYIATAYDDEAEAPSRGPQLCNVIVMKAGFDKKALEAWEVGQLDETIEYVRPHVLVGPKLWEFRT